METIDKIRNATFTLTRRGYDRREVDNYLSKLADWLEGGGADQVHSDTIKHDLQQVGRKTSQILTEAQDSAESLRTDAHNDARQIVEQARIHVQSTRSAADQYAKQARKEADDYAKRVRSEADAGASEVLSSAEAKAIRMVEEGTKRRREIEKVIADLQTRREAVVKGLEKLSSQLAGVATEGVSAGAKPPSPSLTATNEKPPATDAAPPAPTRQ